MFKIDLMLRKMQFVLSVSLFLFATTAGAQMTEGVITYEFRQDMHRSIPPEREEMKAMIPQFRTENFVLAFNAHERFYKAEVDVSQMATGGGPGGGRRMGFRTPRMDIYANQATGEWLGSMDFMGKNYLITDSLTLAPWRLGTEYMDIAGYRCQMAWYVDTLTNEEITAWFTLGIQPFLGPDRFVSLPGTILALDINNGERLWVARKIESRPLVRDDIRKPTRGERVTREEFRKITEEQMERMRNQGGRF
jgi:GLPGLI family protein